MRAEKQLPEAKALLLFQQNLATSQFAQRHLDALENNAESIGPFVGLMECTRRLHEWQEKLGRAEVTPAQMRTMTTRNLLCVTHAACPDEAKAWVKCMRSIVTHKKRMAGAEGAEGAASSEPAPNCAGLRTELELCTQRVSTGMLHAASETPKLHDLKLPPMLDPQRYFHPPKLRPGQGVPWDPDTPRQTPRLHPVREMVPWDR